MKKILWSIAALLLTVSLLAALNLNTRSEPEVGTVLVNGECIRFSELPLKQIAGSAVNGKGEVREIRTSGIFLSELLPNADSGVRISASDAYSASVQAAEFFNACLILCEDGSVRLIVFGDENSKRDVKNVISIVWEEKTPAN